jgi:hypothetical protein
MNDERLSKANKTKEEIERTAKYVVNCRIALENRHSIIVGSGHTKDYNFVLPEDVRECVMRTALAALENKLEKLRKEFDEL